MSASYYGAGNQLGTLVSWNGHPDEEYGWAVSGGLRLNAPMIGPGDYFQAAVHYAQGATNYTGWMVWAKAVEKAGSFDRVPVTEALEDGIELVSPLGRVATEPKSHHKIMTMHLAALNDEQGWDIIESYEDVPPSDTMQRCDLIANPDTHTQFQPE